MTVSKAALPKVSVVIPTYNRADLLRVAIQSALGQTFPDLEILVVDDGSTDSTPQVVRQVRDPRLIYIRQPHSGLPAVARNTGLRQARGEYIAFLDSDDLWLPEKLALQVEYMDEHPEVGLVYANAFTFTGDPPQSDPGPLLRPGGGLTGHVFEQLYGHPQIPNLTVLIRAALVETVGLFDEDERLKANEDYEYWLRIAGRYPIGYIDRPLACYRQHAQGISKASVATNQAKLFLIGRLDHLYPDFVARHRKQRARWLARVHYGLGRALLREQRVSEARHELRVSWRLQRRCPTLLFLGASYCGRAIYEQLDGARSRLHQRGPRHRGPQEM
jgi:glycosyltransferase involved in cell wall biosynthesis